ncbi:imidazolonepropionase [Microbispora sp. NPDC049125]|uniref:imidazolonepropionase n=1 Tax=Microbispora sp. NPDC049125 TaxID=3154929 RepID=UPI003465ABDC
MRPSGRTSTVFVGIGLLFTADPQREEIEDAALLAEDGVVRWIGRSADAPPADERVDVEGRAVVPGFVDSHAHLVFAGDRTAEFAARMAGEAYSAGGIRTTVAATRRATIPELVSNTAALVSEMAVQGTTTFEIKSGYGLTVEDERRSLEIACQFTPETTYLGAHVVPPEMTADDYVSMVTGPMLDACAPYAKWVDVFCERGAFDEDQSREVLMAGVKAGLRARVHANQLGEGPGVRLACEMRAASADHCTHLSDADVDALACAGVVATLLPGAEFSTRSPYPDARRLLDAGVTVALATDCNPGTSFTTSMAFCVALAVREMRMTPAEALRAATLGGARALRRSDVGVLRPGNSADLVVLDAPSYVHLAYRPGVPLVAQVWREGLRVV